MLQSSLSFNLQHFSGRSLEGENSLAKIDAWWDRYQSTNHDQFNVTGQDKIEALWKNNPNNSGDQDTNPEKKPKNRGLWWKIPAGVVAAISTSGLLWLNSPASSPDTLPGLKATSSVQPASEKKRDPGYKPLKAKEVSIASILKDIAKKDSSAVYFLENYIKTSCPKVHKKAITNLTRRFLRQLDKSLPLETAKQTNTHLFNEKTKNIVELLSKGIKANSFPQEREEEILKTGAKQTYDSDNTLRFVRGTNEEVAFKELKKFIEKNYPKATGR